MESVELAPHRRLTPLPAKCGWHPHRALWDETRKNYLVKSMKEDFKYDTNAIFQKASDAYALARKHESQIDGLLGELLKMEAAITGNPRRVS